MNQEDMIINRPQLLRPHHKLTAFSLTVFFWAALLYLWQPLASLLAWSLNLGFFYHHMVILGGYEGFIELLKYYAVAVSTICTVFLVWAKVNEWRFRDSNRRSAPTQTDRARLCQSFGVSEMQLERWQQCRVLVCDVDASSGEVRVLRESSPGDFPEPPPEKTGDNNKQ